MKLNQQSAVAAMASIFLGAVMLALFVAQGPAPAQDPQKAIAAAEENVKITPLRRGSALIGRELKREGGAVVGSLRDLVIDSQDGRIAYAIIQLGEDGKYFAVPFELVKEDAARRNLVLNARTEQLDTKRAFEADTWPAMNDEAWAKEVHTHFGLRPYWEDEDPFTEQSPAPTTQTPIDPKQTPKARPAISREHFWSNRLTAMNGKQIHNTANETLGTMTDVVIDMRGRAVYGVVKIGEAEDAKFAAVPWAAITAEGAKSRYIIEADQSMLERTSFKESAWPNLHDVYWARKNHEAFKREPYWLVYGYSIDDEFGIHWRSGSAYDKSFQGQSAQTLEGFVTEIKEFSPARDAEKGRLIVLRLEDGSTQIVHLGPVAFLDLQREKFNLSKGDKITVTGTMGKYEDGQVMRVGELKSKSGVLNIRDEKGRPQWELDSRQRNRDFRRQYEREKKKEKSEAPPPRDER